METNETSLLTGSIYGTPDLDFDYRNNTVFWIDGSTLKRTSLHSYQTYCKLIIQTWIVSWSAPTKSSQCQGWADYKSEII